MTVDDLAIIVGNGFNDVQKEFEVVKQDITELKDGQEQIKLRLDNVAYRFELKDLDKRVTRLERKAGIENH